MYGLLIAINALDEHVASGNGDADTESLIRGLVTEFESLLRDVQFDLDALTKFVEASELKCPFAINHLKGTCT
jgi:hypothetical protein